MQSTSLGDSTSATDTVADLVEERHEVLTRSEVETRVGVMQQDGWTVLACDDPACGTRGYFAYRYVAVDTRELVRVDENSDSWVRVDGSRFLSASCKVTPETEALPRARVLEEVLILEWPLFDKPLTPDIQVVEPGELARLLTADCNYSACSDPKALLLGFVWYKPEEGKAIVRRVRLTRVRSEAPEYKAVILAAMEKTRVQQEP